MNTLSLLKRDVSMSLPGMNLNNDFLNKKILFGFYNILQILCNYHNYLKILFFHNKPSIKSLSFIIYKFTIKIIANFY
jgi:hypothetical protein